MAKVTLLVPEKMNVTSEAKPIQRVAPVRPPGNEVAVATDIVEVQVIRNGKPI